MSGTKHYDLCVVGAGLIGSAAARHIAEAPGHRSVLLIGPTEHPDRSQMEIHGAHYDEGRITRVLDPDFIWGTFAHRAIQHYRDLEKKSGIPFYTEVGCLCIGLENGEYIHNITKHARLVGMEPEFLDQISLKSRFPYMSFNPSHVGRFTRLQGGHVSPRKLVEAEKKAAHMAGCDVIDDVVARVEPCSVYGNKIVTDRGRHLSASRVLLATGAFTGCRQVLPPGVQPRYTLRCETVLLVEVRDAVLERMRDMPSVIVKSTVEGEEIGNFRCYILPPIKYPDGKYYLKIGHGNLVNQTVCTPEEIRKWYSSGCDLTINKHLLYMARKIFPEMPILNYKWDRCVTTHNESGYPYVAMVTPSLGVAIGGCGGAAKSGDEIGYMAARMLMKGEWDYDIPAEHFRFRTTGTSKL